MQATEINIDNVVNYRSEYCSAIKKHKIAGDNLTGLCPFHNDGNNSFSVDLKTGMWKCHAEDIGGNFITFYAQLNHLDTKEAYKQILDRYGVASDSPKPKEKPRSTLQNYTVTQYAFEKRLPEKWLSEHCGLRTKKDRYGIQYLHVPYFDSEMQEITFRKRYAKKQFRWKYGAGKDLCPYGAWKMESIRQAGYVVLVEGESDSHSMWHMEIATLGIPGASMFRSDWAALFQDLKLYLHVELDKGGETFLRKATKALRDGGFIGEAYQWSCKSIGCKDPSDVYIKYGKEEAAKRIMAAIKGAESLDISEENVPEAVEGAPVNLRQPEGWIYSEKGISIIDEKKYMPVNVCRTPIIITQRLRSMETGEEKIEIAFKRDGEWNKAILSRSTVFTSRGVTVLADLGCTVTSENAKHIVSFLSALESENIDIIMKADSTSTFGWQTKNRFLPGFDKGIVLDIDPSQRAMATAYCQNGTFKSWIDHMKPHRERDKFRFLMAASFTAPLLRILKQRIFFVYNWGGSKGGKTAALKAALSAWGDPERLMVNFNATQVGMERTASFYCDLPLGIDERQLAGNNQNSLEKIVYMIASGTGKIRGAKSGGIQAMQTWRTVAIATGEEPLSTETSQTGVSTRVLEIYGRPFDDEKEASVMHQQSSINCGWAGPAFIERLMQTDEKSIVEKYEEMSEYVHGISDGKNRSHVAGIAAVVLADAMISTWIFDNDNNDFSSENSNINSDICNRESKSLKITTQAWDRAKQMAETILMDQMGAETGDVNENATQYIVDWILSNKAYFGTKVIGTCLGFTNNGKAYIYPSMLNQALTKAGYSPRKTMKYLADNNLIGVGQRAGGGIQYSVMKWFDNRSCRFVEFHIGKFAEERNPLNEEEAIASQMNILDENGFQSVDSEEELPFD